MRSLRAVPFILALSLAASLNVAMPDSARADSDIVIQIDAGAMNSSTIEQLIATSETYDSLSDFLLVQLQAPEMDALTPDAATLNLAEFDFDGEIVETDTGFEVVIPGAEVHSEKPNWSNWTNLIVAGLVGWGMLSLTGFLCYATMTPANPLAPPICNAFGKFSGAFSAKILYSWLSKPEGSFGTRDDWLEAFTAGMLAAGLGAFWDKFRPWANANAKDIMVQLGNWIVRNAKSFGGWFGAKVLEGTTWVAEQLAAIGPRLYEWFVRTARKLGLEVAVVPGAQQIIAVPSYIHPGADPGAWTRLIDASSGKVGVAVANVLNGPGSEHVDSWAGVIDRTHASGKRMLGYVDTGYLGQTGMRTRLGSTNPADWIAQAEQDVDAWYTLYGDSMDGIFLDDGFNQCGAGNSFITMYTVLNQYIKTRHFGAMTVLNPGTVVPQCYEYTADVLLTYEGGYAGYMGTNSDPALNYKELGWTPTDPYKIWHIIFDVSTASIGSVVAASKARGAGYLDVTDDVLSNPYDTLPASAYWTAEQAAVEGGTHVVDLPTAYTAGAALASKPSGITMRSSDYTSASLEWGSATNATDYLIYLNDKVVADLPATMTAVTIGGLAPGGGTMYQFKVTARGASGVESASTAYVATITPDLPGGQTVTNAKVVQSGGTATYSADFVTPYSFHRVYITPSDDVNVTCWWVRYQDSPNNRCAHWIIENSTLLVYTGTEVGQWSWAPVAYLPPTVNGYTYSWAVNTANIVGASADHFVMQGEGYSPLTSIFVPDCTGGAWGICN